MRIKEYTDEKYIHSCFEDTNESEKYKIQKIVKTDNFDPIACPVCSEMFNSKKETAYIQIQKFYPKGILGKSITAKCTLIFHTCDKCKKIFGYAQVGCAKREVDKTISNRYELILK